MRAPDLQQIDVQLLVPEGHIPQDRRLQQTRLIVDQAFTGMFFLLSQRSDYTPDSLRLLRLFSSLLISSGAIGHSH